MIIVMATLFLLSHQPSGQFAHLRFIRIEHFDKVAHFFIYGVLAGTVLYAFRPEVRRRRPVWAALLTIGICLCYGISDEFHQSFVPGRTMSAADLVADLCGSIAGCWLYLMQDRRR